jgi:TetR/AcrR family fatty acid metabolism transcriptional regulator
VIAHGQSAGVFRKDLNATLASKLLFGMLDEMATNWILSRRKYSLTSEADAIVDLFVRGAAAK